MTIHLPALAACADLPVAGQLAVAEHRDLHLALAQTPTLDPEAFRVLYATHRRPDYEVACALVSRPLADDLVRHVLVAANEDRPAVVGALAAVNAPADADLREQIISMDEPDVAEGVLANPNWTPSEQGRVAAGATGATLLEWLATLDPATDGEFVDAALAAWPGYGADVHRDRLHHDDTDTVLAAAVRWPQLLEVPAELVGPSLRSVTGTLSRSPTVHHRLLDEATELGRRGWGVEAAMLVEAVALNPHASLRVQRRAARIARAVVDCPYLAGWSPATAAGPGGGVMDESRTGRFLDAIERNAHARHRTVWSAVQLAFVADELAPGATDRLVAHLTEHGRAAGLDRRTAALALARHHLEEPARDRCLRQLWHHPDEPRPLYDSVVGLLAGVDTEGTYEPTHAERDARELARWLGDHTEAWSLAVVLLRDGWDRDIAELAVVVSQLVTGEGSAA